MGSEEENGVIWMSLVYIFKAVQKVRGVQGISLSYYEIYNEVLSDLLSFNGVSLPIIYDPAEGHHVQGATTMPIASAKEGMELLKKAEFHRRFLMLRSDLRRCSRSSTVLRVVLKTTAGDASAWFVDLASSGSWDSQTEGQSSVLGRAEGGVGVARSVVNLRGIIRGLGSSAESTKLFRPRVNSKLMKVLDHCVLGTSRLAFICTISPAQSCEEGSIRTLHFATDVSRIPNKPIIQDTVPSDFYQETASRTAKPLFRVRTQIDALWEELVPFCKLCQVTSNLPVPSQLLIEVMNSCAGKIKTLETEMGDLRNQILPALHGDKSDSAGKRLGVRRSSSFPSLADTEKLQAFVESQREPTRAPSGGSASNVNSMGAAGLPPSGRGLRRSATEKQVKKPDEESPAKPKKNLDFGWRSRERGRQREEALQKMSERSERRASSAGRGGGGEDTPGRLVWRRMWEVLEESSAKLEQCNQKLAQARQSTGLTATMSSSKSGVNSNMGRLGGGFGQTVKPAEQARRKHDDWRAQVEKLREELKIMNQRVAIVGDMPVLSERMQELSKMEIQLEMKKKKVIDKAIEAQEEAVTRLLNYRRSSSGNAALAAEPPPVVLTGANHAVTSGEQSASAHAQMPEPGGDDGGDKDDPHDPHDTQHVAASQGPESGGESREDVSDLPSSKPQPPTSSGSNGPASMKGAPPPGGWPEVSNDQRRAMRQSRDKPWTAGSTRSIKTQLRQAVSESRTQSSVDRDDGPGDLTPASTRPSSSIADRTDMGDASSQASSQAPSAASGASAASAAVTEAASRRRARKEYQRPWRTASTPAGHANEGWDKLRSAVKQRDEALLEGPKEGESEADAEGNPFTVSNASSIPQESAKGSEDNSEADGDATPDGDSQAGKDFGEQLRLAAAAAVEFPEEWHTTDNVQWAGWVRWILYGEAFEFAGPPNESNMEAVQATLEDLWSHEIQAVESLCLKVLIAIEKVGEEVMAKQRDGTFCTSELLWDLPKLTPLENHVITAFGDNRFGQLGSGTASGEGQTPGEVPRTIYDGHQPLAVACSWRNTVIVTDNHQLIQLGVRDMTQGAIEGKPQRGALVIQSQVTHLPVPGHQIMAVACGWQHSMALSGAGAVFSWGYGGYGALGHGNMYSSMKPLLVEGLLGKMVQYIAAGSYSSTAITCTGHLFTWGWGLGGQLGHGTRNNQMLPLLVEQDCHGEALQPLRKVACGHQHIVALTRAGRLFSAGLGKNGRLGFSSILEETRFRRVERTSMNEEVLWIQDVCAGFAHTAALDTNGRVLTCGDGTTGALGHGTPFQDFFFLKIVEAIPRATMIACGGFFTTVATEDKTVWTWGRNDYRQLGRKCFFRWEPQRKAVGRFQGVGEEKLADAIRLGVQDLQEAHSIPDPLAIEDAYPSPATDVTAVNIPGAGIMIALQAGHSHVTILTRQQKAYGLKPGESRPATFTMGISMRIAGSPEKKKPADKATDASAMIEAHSASATFPASEAAPKAQRSEPPSPSPSSATSRPSSRAGARPPSPTASPSPSPSSRGGRAASPAGGFRESTPRTSLPPIEPSPASRPSTPPPGGRARSRSASRERGGRPRSLSREAQAERPVTASRLHLLSPLPPSHPMASHSIANRQREAASAAGGPLRAPSREGRSPETEAEALRPRRISRSPEPLVPLPPDSGPGSRPLSGRSRPGSRGGRPTS